MSLTPLERLRQLKSQHPSLSSSVAKSEESLPVKPFTGVKSSLFLNPLAWWRQNNTEGELQTDIHRNSLENLAERVKAYDDAQTRAAQYAAKVQEIRVDEQTERRAQQQFRDSATNGCIGTSDGIETLTSYRSLRRPELEKALAGDPLKEKILREYDLIYAGAVTLLRLNLHGQKSDPVGFSKEELL